MKAAIFERHGGVAELTVADLPDPECGNGDVIVRVGATSLNGFDPMILAGSTGLKTPLPMTPCGDFAGQIVERGADVTGWEIGDRVCPHPFVLGEGMTGETRIGAASQYVRIPAANLITTPDGVSDVEAAALPIAYGTAYRMMTTRGKIQVGEKVLILGATGGVGTCCVQLAKSLGAEVIVTGSAEWKLDKLRETSAAKAAAAAAESSRHRQEAAEQLAEARPLFVTVFFLRSIGTIILGSGAARVLFLSSRARNCF